jgi:hypothetical protein
MGYRNKTGIKKLNKELSLIGKRHCPICKQDLTLDNFAQLKGPYCKNCTNTREREFRVTHSEENVARQHSYDTKYAKELGILYYARRSVAWCKTRSKRDNIPFDITVDYVVRQWELQKGRCFYSNEELVFNLPGKTTGIPSGTTPSLDKIDPAKGYVTGNVVWCAFWVNRMKFTYTMEEFLHKIDTIRGVHGRT